MFRVTVGEENIYTFTITDYYYIDGYSVEIEGGTPPGGNLTSDGNTTFTFSWTPETVPTHALSFIVTDDLGAASILSPFVQICACFNGGECTEQGVPSTIDNIQSLNCLCTEGK